MIGADQAATELGGNRVRHKKSASTSSLAAWAKTLPKAVLMPSIKLDKKVVATQKTGLSAFAAPFLHTPIQVNKEGGLVVDVDAGDQEYLRENRNTDIMTSPVGHSAHRAVAKQRLDTGEPNTIGSSRQKDRAPEANSLVEGPPAGSKTVVIAEEDHSNSEFKTHLAPPQSAISILGTESDPATPWDPAIQRKKIFDAAQAAKEFTNPEYYDAVFDFPLVYPLDLSQAGGAPTYPWGMPMSPVVDGEHDSLPIIPGGPGVIWTPAGWAVQDIAMKYSLRAAEVKMQYSDSKKKAKSYYKSK